MKVEILKMETLMMKMKKMRSLYLKRKELNIKKYK
jgi:hypothetical protein